MNDRSQMAFSPIKQMKNHRSQKKNLKFAENRVDKVTRQLVSQTAIVEAYRVNCFLAEPDNALLARIYDRRRRAMDYLLRVKACR
ncbi:hypothetical protein [Rhizobium sp. BK418]|uniref:hypothetical protein n=1 Tax=Rhizobium sp. BK418 TaxID=2512120 RepID=UPI00104FDB2B|nr:hypothetical protein [Rhizobium sp. BK418]TCR94782.1 hypothetical protein EV281_11536 [Rhizobium sp. BK418]